MNLAAQMQRSGRVWRDKSAVALGTRVLRTYGEVADRVSRLAGALVHDFGLRPGDRVALVSKNCPEYLEVFYACWHAGLVAVPANAKLHADDFNFILDDCGARAAFVSAELVSTIGALELPTLERVVEIGAGEYERLVRHDRLDLVQRRPEDLAWLFYTSGTTGRPKGAMLTHRNLLAMCHAYFADVDPGAPWSAMAHAAPMSHGSGLYAIAHVSQGSCHVVPESGGFDAREIYGLIEHWPGLCLFAAPTMLKRLLDDDPAGATDKLKTIMYGGGPMYVEDLLRALDRFGPKLSQLYGQGESPMTITALGPAFHTNRDDPHWLERLGSVGPAQSVVEVRVVDATDRTLPTGEIGEIVVRGDTVMAGYWRNEAASKVALAGGWLHTGDVGRLDEGGFLTLKDRIKDMIISGGSNIYPREVEEVLLRHPQVSEASVIGRPDREWGEVVVAFVVPAAGCELDPAALDAFCLDHMARFKRPKDYRSTAALPKNNYGKVLKTALRERDESPSPGTGRNCS